MSAPNSEKRARDVYTEGLPEYAYKGELKTMRSILSETKPRREIPWIYMVVVAGAPVAHWLVTASTLAKTKRTKHAIWGAALGATVITVYNRLVLWHDAGYAGSERPKSERFVEYDPQTGKPKHESAISIKALLPV